ncbi:T-cell activation Rho GTPase activating protein, putative [Entamoeba dispar SAW760]|uniref:T-cell activation Rho GTPase activating protein, putative n=1 Tax=Entamoeba dispar (strain ATCC PRA-260 / SAW760) TaxID=370354 RepID=B0EMD6_ENTDS|nr:T-cell activation Rho GTPase activating protein, putative [Entamoeba dispar SAW760]EDR24354.1 T-cell activation Rho GTPase activating protein, putative [Entamoeba dispar SAW760]|eukprot:EDR24354.1 T-cell activation Rho GTPase activating protein, putative [Entamoeba dispar SAW760]
MTSYKINLKLIDESCSFWEKQMKFAKSVDGEIEKISVLMINYGNYIESFVTQINPKPIHIDIHSLSTILNGFRSVCDTFLMLQKQFQDLVLQPTKTINNKIDELKKPIKEAKKNEVNEIAAFQFHKIHEYLKVQTPLFFVDYFRVFVSHYELGKKYIPDLNVYQNMYNNAVLNSQLEEPSLDKTIIYSQPLISILTAEGRTVNQLPRAIEEIFKILYTKGCYTKGIFRENSLASKDTIDKLVISISFTSFEQYPPEVTAAVLKSFMRGMIEPVVDINTAFTLIETWKNVSESTYGLKDKISGATALIQSLPPSHFTMFSQFIKLCYKIHTYSDINLMNAKNLAVCIAPVIIHIPNETLESTTLSISFITFVIENYPSIFPDDVDKNLYRRTLSQNVLQIKQKVVEHSEIISPQKQTFLSPKKIIPPKDILNHQRKISSSCPNSPRSIGLMRGLQKEMSQTQQTMSTLGKIIEDNKMSQTKLSSPYNISPNETYQKLKPSHSQTSINEMEKQQNSYYKEDEYKKCHPLKPSVPSSVAMLAKKYSSKTNNFN